MKRYTVVVSDFARNQVDEQVLYISQDSIDYALAWEGRLKTAILALGESPGHAVDQDATKRVGSIVRKLVFEGTYLVHYRLNEEQTRVDVINFRHGARLPRRGEP